MKRLLIGLIFIISGYLIGNIIFSTNISLFKENSHNNLYFIKNEKTNDYLGITKDLEVIETIQNIYKEQGINSIVTEKNVASKEINRNINQFDTLIKSSEKEQDILTIENVALVNYQKVYGKN